MCCTVSLYNKKKRFLLSKMSLRLLISGPCPQFFVAVTRAAKQIRGLLTGTSSTFPVAAAYPRSCDSLRFTSASAEFDPIFLTSSDRNRFPPFTCNKQYLHV